MSERIAQTVGKASLEPELEKHCHPASYGSRPGKAAWDAVGVARKRCWRSNGGVNLDLQAFVDTMSHALRRRAGRKHPDGRWVLLSLERGLTAPVHLPDGPLEPRAKGARRAQSGRPCWRIALGTMRVTGGCRGMIQASRASVTRRIASATAAARPQPERWGRCWSSALRRAD